MLISCGADDDGWGDLGLIRFASVGILEATVDESIAGTGCERLVTRAPGREVLCIL